LFLRPPDVAQRPHGQQRGGRERGGGEGRGGEGREGEGRGGEGDASAWTLGCVRTDAVFTASADGKNPSAGKTPSAG
jgi:hypothetical protein